MHELRHKAAQEALAANQYVRVAACNAWVDEHRREQRFEDLAEIFENLQIDAVCIQEVPNEASAEHLGRLTGGTGLQVVAHVVGSVGGTAILLRGSGTEEAPILTTGIGAKGEAYSRAHAVVRWATQGYTVRSCSVHQPWGGLLEPMRLLSAVTIEEEFAKREPCDLAYIAGDFNTQQGSESIRYLTGLAPYAGKVAQWTDAWAYSGDGEGCTSSPENPYAILVGEQNSHGDPRMLPERRIDYIFTRGYTHGRAGTALRSFVHRDGVGGDTYPSDHWLLVADLYLPHRRIDE